MPRQFSFEGHTYGLPDGVSDQEALDYLNTQHPPDNSNLPLPLDTRAQRDHSDEGFVAHAKKTLLDFPDAFLSGRVVTGPLESLRDDMQNYLTNPTFHNSLRAIPGVGLAEDWLKRPFETAASGDLPGAFGDAFDMAAQIAAPELARGLPPALDAAGKTKAAAVTRGAAKGAWRGGTEMIPVVHGVVPKLLGLPEVNLPAVLAGAGGGSAAGGVIGAPFGMAEPGAVVGAGVGAVSPVVRGAVQGGKEALRKFEALQRTATQNPQPGWMKAGIQPVAGAPSVTPALPADLSLPSRRGPGSMTHGQSLSALSDLQDNFAGDQARQAAFKSGVERFTTFPGSSVTPAPQIGPVDFPSGRVAGPAPAPPAPAPVAARAPLWEQLRDLVPQAKEPAAGPTPATWTPRQITHIPDPAAVAAEASGRPAPAPIKAGKQPSTKPSSIAPVTAAPVVPPVAPPPLAAAATASAAPITPVAPVAPVPPVDIPVGAGPVKSGAYGFTHPAQSITDLRKQLFATGQELDLEGSPSKMRATDQIRKSSMAVFGKSVSNLSYEELYKLNEYLARHGELPGKGDIQ